VEKLRVREFDLYLNKHALTTVGRKLDKVKTTQCHYYRHNKEAVIREELSSDEDVMESEDEEFKSLRRQRATVTLFSRIWMNRVALLRQFSSYLMSK